MFRNYRIKGIGLLIKIEELKRRIIELLNLLKRRTKCFACSLIDKDGFVIDTIKDDILKDAVYEKCVIKLLMEIEALTNHNPEIIDYKNKVATISFNYEGDIFDRGFIVLIHQISDFLFLISMVPLVLDIDSIKQEFSKISREFSRYLIESENREFLDQLYKLV